jgi:ubiquinone biosynthesis protein
MLYFIIRVLVNALALAITFIVLPGFVISPFRAEPLAVTYLTLGLILGIIQALVRPALILLTARLVVSSLGLFIFAINVVLFWIMVLAAPRVIVLRPPEFVWLIVGSLTLALAVTIAEAIFGLDSPMTTGENRSRFYWRWLGRLPTGRRNRLVENLRVYFILRTIFMYTEDIAVGYTPLARFRIHMQRLLYGERDTISDEPMPAKVRVLLQDLGPTFVKFGQVVSSRSKDLPVEWQRELAKLQSNVPPFPYDEARRIITDELGEPPEKLYATFDEKPLAAASTAQVHRATLHDGTQVVVKVQRPDIDVTVKADLNVMRDLAAVLQQRQEWARELDAKGLVNEFADGVLLELNYDNESLNARQLAFNMRDLPCVHVPKMYPELSSSKVLTQEFITGVKITAVEKLDAAGVDRTALAREFLRAMLKQVLFDGFFHADPHPGNIWADPKTAQVVFLDMGMMGNMTKDQRLALAELIWALHDRDGQSLAKTVIQLSTPFKDVDEAKFIGDAERLMKRYLMFGDEQMNLSGPLQEMLNAMRRAGLRLDPSLTLALKAMFQAEETVRTLDPRLPLVAVAFEELKHLFQSQLDSDSVISTIKTEALRTAKEVVRRIPSLAGATTKWLDQYERGRFSVHVDTSDIAKEVDKLDSALTRNVTLLVLALLLVGLLIGSAIASTLQTELINGVKLAHIAFSLFLGGAVIATALVLGIVWRMWRSQSASSSNNTR